MNPLFPIAGAAGAAALAWRSKGRRAYSRLFKKSDLRQVGWVSTVELLRPDGSSKGIWETAVFDEHGVLLDSYVAGNETEAYRNHESADAVWWNLKPDPKGRRAARDPNVSAGKLQFYRGGTGSLRPGPAYFTSGEWLAKMYGPVKKHRLYLRNPKFVTDREWGGFDSTALRFDPSPANRLRSQGHDSAVWIKNTPKGVLYNVYALAGTDAIKKPKGGSSSIQAAFQAALEAENWADDAQKLKLLRRVAKRLNIDVTGLTTWQGDGYTEVYDKRGRVWLGPSTPASDAKSEYIEELIRKKLGISDQQHIAKLIRRKIGTS